MSRDTAYDVCYLVGANHKVPCANEHYPCLNETGVMAHESLSV